MKIIFLILNTVLFLNASNVEVLADKFFADEKQQISKFTGNVKVTKQSDILTAEEVVITFNKKREPLKYTATGNAKLDITINAKQYKASANIMIYNPILNQYTFIKKAFLHEIATDKKVYGNKIVINQLTGKYQVDSDGKKPVKFIFKVKDSK